MTISLLQRLKIMVRGRRMLNAHEQIVSECIDEIERLQSQRRKDLEMAAKVVEDYEVPTKTIVGKIRVDDRKRDIASKIRDLI